MRAFWLGHMPPAQDGHIRQLWGEEVPTAGSCSGPLPDIKQLLSVWTTA